LDHSDEFLHTHHADHPADIIGENRQAHLCFDILEAFGQEVRGAHPRFERSEWMLNCRPSDRHGFRKIVQSSEHGVDNIFVHPAFDTPLFARRAFGFNRTDRASIRPVNLHVFALLNRHEAIGHLLTAWALIAIILRPIEEVVLTKAARSFRARGVRLTKVALRKSLFWFQADTSFLVIKKEV